MLYLSRKNLFLRKKKNRTSAESISVSVSLITLRSVKSVGLAKQLRMLRPIDISLLLSTESLNLLNVDSSFSYFSSLIFNSVINFSFWSSKVWRLWRRFSFSASSCCCLLFYFFSIVHSFCVWLVMHYYSAVVRFIIAA